ncbi:MULTISPECIES: ArdC-like ssDNA-binding domain-containing protein [unclassified Bradyrhizobium]|uniref:ArdC-like ssDNA-binding domain-containing protein n=1 Tax=unclassified Bradyrhizobium TaxID=2631580 RepID=UPI0029170520|nr:MULTISPECIES: ArdC-like ssDNA-binding domain-containing protein [unclassified Bradyrhizobium]
MTSTKPRRDIYQEITNRIVAELEKGTPPWRKPWTSVAARPGRTRTCNQTVMSVGL